MTTRGEDCWVIDISLHYPLHSLLMLMISYVRILARLPRVRRLEILATHGHTPDRTWTLCGNSEVTCGLTRYLLYIMCISRNKSHKISRSWLLEIQSGWMLDQCPACWYAGQGPADAACLRWRWRELICHPHTVTAAPAGIKEVSRTQQGHTTKLTYFV